MDKRFPIFLKEILKHEGGKVDHPSDPGGKTNKGITQGTYNAYLKSKKQKSKDVFTITDNEVSAIYYERYYIASGADKIKADNLAFIHFDTAVNFGVGRAKEFLSKSKNDIKKYDALRREHRTNVIAKNPARAVFKKGWEKRDNAVYAFSLNQKNTNANIWQNVPEWA